MTDAGEEIYEGMKADYLAWYYRRRITWLLRYLAGLVRRARGEL